MVNPYTPSQPPVETSDRRHAAPSPARSATSPIFLLACFSVGIVLGLYLCAIFFQWLNRGQILHDVAIQQTMRKLVAPTFVVPCLAFSLSLTRGWRGIRKKWHSVYMPTPISRIAAGCIFVCTFYTSANVIKYPLWAVIGTGTGELIPVVLGLLTAAVVAVESESAYFHFVPLRTPTVSGEP